MSVLKLYNSSLGTLNISQITNWQEKADIQYKIKRFPNQSIAIQLQKNPIRQYSLDAIISNHSTKNEVYNFVGYKMDYMSYGNFSQSNIWITDYAPTKKPGSNEKWEARLELLRE